MTLCEGKMRMVGKAPLEPPTHTRAIPNTTTLGCRSYLALGNFMDLSESYKTGMISIPTWYDGGKF